MLNTKSYILVDFIVIPDICTPLVIPGKGLDEMILSSNEVIELTGESPC